NKAEYQEETRASSAQAVVQMAFELVKTIIEIGFKIRDVLENIEGNNKECDKIRDSVRTERRLEVAPRGADNEEPSCEQPWPDGGL
ncbi:unnamed protein product, partial [Urochloa humidicola]